MNKITWALLTVLATLSLSQAVWTSRALRDLGRRAEILEQRPAQTAAPIPVAVSPSCGIPSQIPAPVDLKALVRAELGQALRETRNAPQAQAPSVPGDEATPASREDVMAQGQTLRMEALQEALLLQPGQRDRLEQVWKAWLEEEKRLRQEQRRIGKGTRYDTVFQDRREVAERAIADMKAALTPSQAATFDQLAQTRPELFRTFAEEATQPTGFPLAP